MYNLYIYDLVCRYQHGKGPARITLVDAGMVAKLYGNQRRHFVRLLVRASRIVPLFLFVCMCVGFGVVSSVSVAWWFVSSMRNTLVLFGSSGRGGAT